MWSAAGSLTGAPDHPFTDVAPTAWYDQGLDWAAAAGIVSGFPGQAFRPRDPVNRGQAVSWFDLTAVAVNAG